MSMMSIKQTSIQLWFVFHLLLSQWTALAIPDGFIDEGVTDCDRCTDMNWATPPGEGRGLCMYITKKEGIVYEVDQPFGVNVEKREILNYVGQNRVCTNGERGFVKLQPHPDFQTNGIMFVFYTAWQPIGCSGEFVEGPTTQLVRFTYNPGTRMLENEEIIFRGGGMWNVIHQGGGMVVGRDNMLWIAVGDGDWRHNTLSHRLNSLQGKILRLTLDGDAAPDNPWYDGGVSCKETGYAPSPDQNCEEIWSVGLRNPFGLDMNPNVLDKTELMVNDVGSATWEECSLAGSDYRGYTHGWPDLEGPCPYAVQGGPVCNQKPEFGYSWSPDGVQFPYVDPFHFFYRYGRDAAVTGAVFIPNGLWPAEYDNARMMIEFPDGKMFRLQERAGCRNCDDRPRSNYEQILFHERLELLNMKFGPYFDTQAMYTISFAGAYLCIRRIRSLVGGNRPPTASLEVSTTQGPSPLVVTFDATGSNDPDMLEMTYHFDFGDGTPPVENNVGFVEHTYTTKGIYYFELTITDTGGLQDHAFETIMAGSPPDVVITEPLEGTMYKVGDVFQLIGAAYDGETGDELSEDHLEWEMILHHNNHWHPWLSATVGNNITSVRAPSPEDFWAANTSHLEIILTATDDLGLEAVASRLLYPVKRYVEFDTNPPGLTLKIDQTTLETPVLALSWENHNLIVDAPDHCGWQFVSWSDGGEREHLVTVPGEDEISRIMVQYERVEVDVPIVDELPIINFDPAVVDCGYKECGRCQGHCEGDDDCADGLICYEKEPFASVPGCEHPDGGTDPSYTSWCIPEEPTGGCGPVVPDPEPTINFVLPVIECGFMECGRCQGHCTSDLSCQDGLICTDKTGAGVPIPGCEHEDGAADPSFTNWCILPEGTGGGGGGGVDPRNLTFYPTPAPVTPAPTTGPPSSAPSSLPSSTPSTSFPSSLPSDTPSFKPVIIATFPPIDALADQNDSTSGHPAIHGVLPTRILLVFLQACILFHQGCFDGFSH